MRKSALLLPLALALAACGGKEPAAAVADADPTAAYQVHEWPLPATEGSAQPDMLVTDDGRLVMSWVNSAPGRRKALQMVSMAENGHWQSAPRTVVVGDSLMASWANVPHIAYTPGVLWIHWLQEAGEGYAADVALSRSTDAGFNWSSPVPVNDDDTETEHGFVSMWPARDGNLGIAWLDGREKAGQPAMSHENMEHHHGEASTQLRAAVFDAALQRSNEQIVDAMTCDCCQTAVAVTAKGPLLVYRDATADNIRDISVSRLDGDTWSEPKPVHNDGWQTNACPVNGPDATGEGNDVLVAWYTGANDTHSVLATRSTDAGDTFAEPVLIDEGKAVLGRVAIAMGDDQAWILWLREDPQSQSLWLSRRSPDLATEYQRVQVATLQGRGRATGFPQIVLRGDEAHVVWTDVVDGSPRLQGAIVSPR